MSAQMEHPRIFRSLHQGLQLNIVKFETLILHNNPITEATNSEFEAASFNNPGKKHFQYQDETT
jgi:hypothetical protein